MSSWQLLSHDESTDLFQYEPLVVEMIQNQGSQNHEDILEEK